MSGFRALSVGRTVVYELAPSSTLQRSLHWYGTLLTLSSSSRSIAESFPSAMRLQIQLDFQHEEGKSCDLNEFGTWIDQKAADILKLSFTFECKVFLVSMERWTVHEVVTFANSCGISDHHRYCTPLHRYL